MHELILLALVLVLLFWFMTRPKPTVFINEEIYVNEPSEIQFTNAEFKFYK